ncbi:hypothetical protein [Paenibacillus sp. FSL L8-0494]|uniref:hypothetical protein n=1 Tax=Paenibacillus sp. FSL L8-0494 TaxID=2975352 RepID=UPI000FA7E027
MSQLSKPEEFQECIEKAVEIYVYSIADINSPPVAVGLITEWFPLRDTVFVNNNRYDLKEYALLTKKI